LDNAPDSLPIPKRERKIKKGLKHFKYSEVSYAHRPALTSMVKTLPDQRGIVFNDGKRNRGVLSFLSSSMELEHELIFTRTPVDF